MKIRTARVIEGREPVEPATIQAYLPRNYTVLMGPDGNWLIVGYDSAGWTLDDYVIPRLASGLHFAEEIALESDPDEKLVAVARAARQVAINAVGTKPKHTRPRPGVEGCRDDCIPCGLIALGQALGMAPYVDMDDRRVS